MAQDIGTSIKRRPARLCAIHLTVFASALVALASFTAPAFASKHAVDFIGAPDTGTLGGEFSGLGGVAVNDSGAGGVPAGTIYAADGGSYDNAEERGNRVQRFERNDNGTPADTSDDTYHFVSAWGAGVEGGGTDFEICVTAERCQRGTGDGGNGTLAGNGSLDKPSGVAVDQDTGEVYVVDSSGRRTADDNFRINVYSATGEFLRSFGWDVIESGPDDNGTGYEVCKAGVDICKAGFPGSGIGQIGEARDGEIAAEGIAVSSPDGNPATGTVFLADQGNQRVSTYSLDGSSPSSFGSAATFAEQFPSGIAVDSREIVYALNSNGGGNEIKRYDSQNANGNGVGFLAPITSPPLLGASRGLAVDPDSDGSGPDADILYVSAESSSFGVQQFGPINKPGLVTPPTTSDETHGIGDPFSRSAIAVESSTGRLDVSGFSPNASNGGGLGIYILDNVGPPPTASLDSLSDATSHGVIAHVTIDPNGPPATRYHLEYSLDGTKWKSTPTAVLGSQETPQTIAVTLDPSGAGLEPNTTYHVRLVAGRPLAAQIVTPDLSFATLEAPPLAETIGSPVRTTTTARLDARVSPENKAATYRFEYGDEGPCDANPCTSTEPRPAGSGSVFELVSQRIEGLRANTAYHYRIVADNGGSGSPVLGKDMTVTTRVSDAPLTHGHFPGPPGSDRAWEQVSIADSGGNPVRGGGQVSVSDDGDRAFYEVYGGTPISSTGTLLSPLFAERTRSGWRSENVYPPRDQLSSTSWLFTEGNSGLSDAIAYNFDFPTGLAALWRVRPGQPASKIFEPEHPRELDETVFISNDASRVLASLKGPHDPAHPAPIGQFALYDVGSGTPRLAGLMPDGSVPPCGVRVAYNGNPYELGGADSRTTQYVVSEDGSRAFFPMGCGAQPQLYMRDFNLEQTKLISGPSVSGPSCGAALIASNSEAVFFWTQTRLSSNDTAPERCELASADAHGGDVYRYDLGEDSLECLTCVVPGLAVDAGPAPLVAEDGSRVYFESSLALLPGAAEGVYRVDAASGELTYLGAGFKIGDVTSRITPDGSALTFVSNSPLLNALGGQQNGGTFQDYLYDDRDRSLVCVSCPEDGSSPVGSAQTHLAFSADGETVAFAAATPLIGADQNTPGPGKNPEGGTDVYEWRDGRLLLVTDGLTNWPTKSAPSVTGMTPSGHDIFFIAAAQYTPDALDSYARLYDARIGGGFEFPPPPKPCPLEVCQGTPKGAPEEAAPGTGSFSGSGNLSHPRTHKKKHHRKQRQHKKQSHKHQAEHDRRAAR